MTETVFSPGLFDLQVNGFAGIDYNDAGLTPEAFEQSLQTMLQTGVTGCLPTIITSSEAHQTACLQALEAARAASPLAQAMVPGYHLEGPFLNPGEGYRGVHPAEHMVPATWEHFQRLQEAAGGRIRLITVAPEQPGVMDLIPRWREQGVTVSLGHCNPSLEEVRAAAAAGAELSTHLGNGTVQLLAKSNNPVFHQLAEDGLKASFIADGFHLPASVLGIYLRAKQSSRTLLVTDGTAGCAAAPGRYTLGPVTIERLEEPKVVLPGTSSPAGSAITLSACVQNVVNWFGVSLEEAVGWASAQPKALLGLPEASVLPEQLTWSVGSSGPELTAVSLGEWQVSAWQDSAASA